MGDESIEGKLFFTYRASPVTIREVSVDDAGAVIDEIKTLHGGLLAAPLDHIVASCETLVALARRVVGPEEAERLRLEIEALEHDATPSDIRAEHDATPSEKGNG